jgi:hypothetical protein
MRKVIQIAITGHANTIQTQCDVTTIALCNDGTMWGMFNFGNDWQSIPLPPGCGTSDERPIPFDRLEELNKERAEMVAVWRHFREHGRVNGLTLREMAELLQVSPVTLSKWTATDPTTEPDFVD